MATARRAQPRPQRTCVGCRETTSKRELIRVVRTPEGRVVADESGKAAGRGAYVHDQASCWEAALKKGRLEHALKVSIMSEDMERLRGQAATARESSL